MINYEAKRLIKASRFFSYEIAEMIGISEYAFSHWFRKDLSLEKLEEIIDAINKLKERKARDDESEICKSAAVKLLSSTKGML